eukprot:scaffold21415_cov57-Cyclotella_meneghiniana.AAC.5
MVMLLTLGASESRQHQTGVGLNKMFTWSAEAFASLHRSCRANREGSSRKRASDGSHSKRTSDGSHSTAKKPTPPVRRSPRKHPLSPYYRLGSGCNLENSMAPPLPSVGNGLMDHDQGISQLTNSQFESQDNTVIPETQYQDDQQVGFSPQTSPNTAAQRTQHYDMDGFTPSPERE